MRQQRHAFVIILDDQELIVLDITDYLEQTGLPIAESFSSGAAWIEWLKVNRADVTMLDIGLREGESAEVDRVLHLRGIPYVVHSGSTSKPDFEDPVFSRSHWISKPSCPDEVIAALKSALTYSCYNGARIVTLDRIQRGLEIPSSK